MFKCGIPPNSKICMREVVGGQDTQKTHARSLGKASVEKPKMSP